MKMLPLSENGMEALKDFIENMVTSTRDRSDILVIRPRNNFNISPNQAIEIKEWIMFTKKWQIESIGSKNIIVKKPDNRNVLEIQLVGGDSSFTTKSKKTVSICEENNLDHLYDTQLEWQASQSQSQSQSQGALSQLWASYSSDDKYENALDRLLHDANKK